MYKYIIIIFLQFLCSLSVCAQEVKPAKSDVENDTTAQATLPTDLHASFLIADPGLDFYSSYGHCVVHLCCPSKGLDFCFTYSLDDNMENKIALFTGKGKGEYAAIKTERFIDDYIEEKRGVYDYELNLTVDQVRKLWQILDNEMSSGAYRKYNYLKTNCSSMSILAVEQCLGSDEIVWKNLHPGITGTYRNFVNTISEHRPWTGFFWTTILGAEGDKEGNMEDKMGPTLIVPALKASSIKSEDGSLRPLLKNEATMLNKSGIEYRDWLFTPTLFFIILTALALLVSLLEWRKKLKGIVITFDIALLIMQTFAGIIVLYLSCFSDMVGAAWNWNLLVLNPLPVLLIIFTRKRKWYNKVWLTFCIVILFYLLLWPFSPQVDLLRVLMVCPLAIRSLTKAALLYKSKSQ